MTNAWTPSQFRVFRILFGLYLLQHFLTLLPWGAELFSSGGVLPNPGVSVLIHLYPNIFLVFDSPQMIVTALGAGAALSLLLMCGRFDRLAAVLLWYLWACLYDRNPLIGNPSLPFIGWLLLAYALIPPLPSKDDVSSAGWNLPGDLYAAAWILMSMAYLYSGYTKLSSPSWVDGSALSRVLANPLARDTGLRVLLLRLSPIFLRVATWSALTLELSFAPLAFSRRLRPWLWCAMVGLHVGLLFLVDFADLTLGMLILHFFTFDPAWIRAPQPARELIFFDGQCALCHGFARMVLAEDRSARPFMLAPLQGDLIKQTLPQSERDRLPDSIVVRDKDGAILTKSSAVLYVFKRLGGLWYVMAFFARPVPAALRDRVYDLVARFRKRIAGNTPQLCPMVPEVWRPRLQS